MNSFLIRFILIISILLIVPSLSYAADEGPYTDIEITANKTIVSPGDTVTLAIINTIAPKWHVYWKNPGDSGAELSMSWTGPE
ncbi:MAG: hypothetical protein MK137_04235, partial [Rickettsiales bacterium]|nr:hypothetical protein [Rickettsiales bacterium]